MTDGLGPSLGDRHGPHLPRVAVTVEQFWHRVPGGTARATAGTIAGLLEVGGFDLVGLAARHQKGEAAKKGLPIPVSCAPLPRPALYEAWHRLGLFTAEKMAGDIDLVWSPSMVVPPSAAPTVVTVNDLDFLHHPERLSVRGRTFFPKAFQVATERATLLVSPTELVAADLADHGVAPERVRTVPLGVEMVEVTEADRARIRSNYNLPERYVLWVGTIEPRKNLPRLVEAMEIVGAPLAVVGPEGWVIDDADLLAPLDHNAYRLGRVPEADLHALYAEAALFVLPSLAEGFGLPVLEAMAQGTPVVTSAGTATEEAAGGAALLVDPLDVESIADGVSSALTDSALIERLISAGRARAASQSWKQTGEGYAAAFTEALA